MPDRKGSHNTSSETVGARAYIEAKSMLEREMAQKQFAYNRGTAPILSYLRKVMGRVEDRGPELTSEELDRIKSEVDTFLWGHSLLDAARNGDATTVRGLVEDGRAPVNFVDPLTGATALHYAAAFRARSAILALLKSGKCDLLIRDKQGRLAWELASNADDPAMTRLLVSKSAKQAREQGVPFRRREPA